MRSVKCSQMSLLLLVILCSIPKSTSPTRQGSYHTRASIHFYQYSVSALTGYYCAIPHRDGPTMPLQQAAKCFTKAPVPPLLRLPSNAWQNPLVQVMCVANANDAQPSRSMIWPFKQLVQHLDGSHRGVWSCHMLLCAAEQGAVPKSSRA